MSTGPATPTRFRRRRRGASARALHGRALSGGTRAAGRRLQRLEAPAVAIERGDRPVVEALLTAGLQVFVITSRQVKALRLRCGTAGNKDDRFDAYVLADVLRTDHRRLSPLEPDSPATVGLRMLVRARKDLVAGRIAAHNHSAAT